MNPIKKYFFLLLFKLFYFDLIIIKENIHYLNNNKY